MQAESATGTPIGCLLDEQAEACSEASMPRRLRPEVLPWRCGSSAERHFARVKVSSLGVYLLFALSSLRESLSCSLRLPPLPLPDTLADYSPPYPAPSIPPHYSCTQRTENPDARGLVYIVLILFTPKSKLLETALLADVDQ